MSTEENKPNADVTGAAPAAPGAPPAAAPAAPPAPGAKAAPQAPPAPKQAQTLVAAPVVSDPDAIKQAIEDLADAEEEVQEVSKYIEASQKELKIRQAKRDAAQMILDKLQPPMTNSNAIQAYLAQQRETLRLRGEQIARAQQFQKENGIKLADLMPKRAPLDMAMARKNARGTGRPGAK